MRKRLKCFLTLMTISFTAISHANCYAKIINASRDSLNIKFSHELPEDGNIYFIDLFTSQCPGSDTDHGIPINGPCIIKAGTEVNFTYTDSFTGMMG